MLRPVLLSGVLLMAALPSLAASPREQAQASWSQAWQAYARSLDWASLDRPAREAAQVEALKLAVEAADLQPADARYAEAAGYIAMAAGKYPQAEQMLLRAKDRASREPRVRLLLAGVYSRNMAGPPDKVKPMVQKALTAFRDAAKLDPTNANPSLAACSVLADFSQPGWEPFLEAGCKAAALRYYNLPLPPELPAAAAWRVQLEYMLAQAARVTNAARFCLRQGQAQADQRAAWQGRADRVLALARQAEPRAAALLTGALRAEQQSLQQSDGAAAARLAALQAAVTALAAPSGAVPAAGQTMADFLEAQAAAVQQTLAGLGQR